MYRTIGKGDVFVEISGIKIGKGDVFVEISSIKPTAV